MPQTRNRLEFVVSLVLLGIGAGALCSIDASEGSASSFLLNQERELGGIDFSTFPKIYAILLMICCAANILLLLKKGLRDSPGKDSRERRRHILLLTGLTAALTLLYTLLLPHMPFILATLAFLFLMFWIYGERHLWKNLAVSAGCSVLFWCVFIKLSHLNI